MTTPTAIQNGETAGHRLQSAGGIQQLPFRGWDVAGVYTDDGISGFKRVHRPGWEALMRDLEDGSVDGVLAWKLDRLGRNRRDYTRLLETVEGQGRSLALVKESVDTSSPFGRVALDLLASFARLESEQTSMRTARALEERARLGRPHVSGQRPFGLTRDWREIVPEEAEAIREATRQILAGVASLEGTARAWNERGRRTSAGKLWRGFTVRRLLQSPHLAALRVHHGEIVAEGDWPAILDRVTHERLKRALAPGRRGRGNLGGGPARYPLSGGLLRCAICDARMVSRPREDKVRRYVCRKQAGDEGCGGVGTLAEPLEELVFKRVSEALDFKSLAGTVLADVDADNEAVELAHELEAIEARLDELAEGFAKGEMDYRSWTVALRALEERQSALRRGLARATPRASALRLFVEEAQLEWGLEDWREWPIERQRGFLAAVLDRVVVGPAVRGRNRFDPDRVDIVFATELLSGVARLIRPEAGAPLPSPKKGTRHQR